MNFFQRLKEGLSKTRGNFTARVDELVEHTQVIDEEFYDELTDILILSDAGVAAAERIIDTLKLQVAEKKVNDAKQAREMFKRIIVEEM